MSNKTYTTPVGTAFYPCLHTPETYEGNEVGYTCKLILSKEETDRLEDLIMQTLEKAKTSPEFANKKWLNEPSIGTGETKEGEVYFKFKKKSSFISKKTKELIRTHVPIFDSQGKPLPKDVVVGNGSRIRVAFSLLPFHMSKNNNGVSLRLEGVQVIELRQGGVNAESLGFSKEEGYQAPEETTPTFGNEGADF